MNTNEPHAKGEFGEPLPQAAGPGVGYYVRKVLKPIASLRLTVVLFVFGMLLIFFGTMAQIDYGIWSVVDKYFWSWIVEVPFDLFRKFGSVFWKEQFPPEGSQWAGTFPLPAGKLLALLMLVNLLAAHITRFRFTWKRAGIILIHSGLLLLFVGEYITREHTIEQRMTIEQGKSTNYTESSRHVEIAIIDKSDPNFDRVVTIPENMLTEPKGRVSLPDVPIDAEVVGGFMVNSSLEKAKPDQANPADTGLGKMWIAKSQPEVSGLDEKQMNYPAVYVKLYKKGTNESLGTYLASLYVNLAGGEEELVVDGKKYEMSLRFVRYYKPFRVYLDKFSFDRFTGTQKAKNYSSDVRVINADGSPGPQQRIAMNEPMRYQGETYYQQSFDKTETTTILQVVKNPGWLKFGFIEISVNYTACLVVGVGLTLHFLIYLIQFLKRLTPRIRVELTGVAMFFPWIILGVVLLYLGSVAMRMGPSKKTVDLDAVGRMPVVDGGRVKPLDTAARVHLRTISGREELVDDQGKKLTAIRWYLELLAGGNPQQRGPVWDYQIIRIDNEQVLRALDFKERDGFRFTMNELGPKIDIIQKRMAVIRKKVADGKKLDTDENKFKELHDRMSTFMELAQFGGPLLLPPRNDKEDWKSLQIFRAESREQAALVAMNDAQKRLFASKKLDQLTAEDEENLVERFHGVDIKKAKIDPGQRASMVAEGVKLLRMKPEMINDEARWDWLMAAASLLPKEQREGIADLYKTTFESKLAAYPVIANWDNLVAAYRDGRANDFAAAVAEYNTVHTANLAEKDRARTQVEVSFQRFAPFFQCTGLYVLVFVLSLIGFVMYVVQSPQWAKAFRRSAITVLLLAFAIHFIALVTRMYIMDRPAVFVTNLYSSAIFIGLGCVALGLIIEAIFPIGVGNMLAAILGMAATIVGHNIATEDTMEMLQAVLDTNFWLSTHVTTVTLGYTATFVAGFIGALYVFQMLGSVIRDSYLKTGEPTVGDLLAFGLAASGVVGIPVGFLAFMTSAMDKFELFPSALLWTAFGLVAVVSLIYALALMLLRVGSPGVDEHNKPVAGQIPNIAKPIEFLALTPERGKIFGQLVYGVVCFATLLSFVGTVLGGIWADYSWGRFWGWDPKENGAVLIVLWNSLILHARWAGLVKDRGVAVLAIFGNSICAWSWFGTNQLSIGLHAYGFDSRLADGCFNFWISQFGIIVLGLIPQRFWSSAMRQFAKPVAAPAKDASVATNPPPATPGAPPPPSTNGATPPHTNGHVNGQPNGHPRRDKGKRRDKRK